MSDDANDPGDLPPTREPDPPTFDSAAVERARNAMRDTIGEASAVPEAVSGAVIGRRYKLLELIGEGGMGVVWMAEQRSPIKRMVAVKLIKAGMDSRAVLARFEAERQALAIMDHPNIARVFDAGTTDRGHPFFVMELVKGLPLTKYCDQRCMSVRERLDLFVQACSAVQHAHQKGIIHRDLKPANLLVTENDGKPVPKVIDFGLAKALGGSSVLTDHTLHTSFGAVAGTPHYMAPEQVAINALDIDTRADIYALGVILYELLTGTTPHELKQLNQAAWDEIRRVIGQVEPPRPSLRITQSDTLVNLAATRHTEPARLSKLVAGDLDWIVMKALEKDRHRRYGTASDLAADLQRHLAGEPVLAAPPTVVYRIRKFTAKHRTTLSTAATIFILLVAGILVSTWEAIRAHREEVVAVSQTNEAQTERAEAQHQREIAIGASKKAETEATTVQRQLADTDVQNGIAAWGQNDPSLATLWFAKALKLDQGDPYRERMDRIRLGDSFRNCAWPSQAKEANAIDEDNFGVSLPLKLKTETNGIVEAIVDNNHLVRVDPGTTGAEMIGDVILASSAESARLWNLSSGKPLTPAFPARQAQLRSPAMGNTEILGIEDGNQVYRLWDAGKSQWLKVAGSSNFTTFEMSGNGKWLAQWEGGKVQVWNTDTLKAFGVPIATNIDTCSISDDGSTLLIRDGIHFKAWNTLEGCPLGPGYDVPNESSAGIMSPDGKKFLIHTGAPRQCLFDTVSGRLLYTLRVGGSDIGDPHPFGFSKDGMHLCQGLRQWDAQISEPITALRRKVSISGATDAGLSEDGKSLATWGNRLRFWSADTLQPLSPPTFDRTFDNAILIPGGHEIVGLAKDGDLARLEVREVGTGRLIRHSTDMDLKDIYFKLVDISPDGTRLLVRRDRSFVIYSVQTFESLISVGAGEIHILRFSPDGRALIGNYPFFALGADSGDVIQNPPNEWRAYAVDGILSTDKKSYLGSDDNHVRVFDVQSNAALSPPLLADSVYDLRGNLALTGVTDSVRLWDASNGWAVTSLMAQKPSLHCAKICKDGTRIISLADNSLCEWSIAPSQFTPDDSALVAEVLAGRKLDDTSVAEVEYEGLQEDRFNKFLQLQQRSPELFADYSPPKPPSEILPSYRDVIESRFAATQTPEQKRTLASEWAYAGWEELRNGLYLEAVALEEKSLLLDDSNLAAKDHLAHAYTCLGRFSDALTIYKSYAGLPYHVAEPWKEDGQVGSDLVGDLAKRWPEGNDNPTLKQIIHIVLPVSQITNDVHSDCRLAIEQFKIGDIPEARRSLHTALQNGKNDADDSDDGRLLHFAQSLIDPASTQPTDDFANDLGGAAWDVVKLPGQSAEKYAYALDLAKRSLDISESPFTLNELGAAQYRVGDYKGALESLARSEATDFVAQENHVDDLAFMAMAQQKLGRKTEARATLQKILEIAKNPDALTDDDKQVLNEAAALIDPSATQPSTQPATAP